MQIVINIPKGRYEDILSGKEFTLYQCDVREVLKKGTPLPEGHGDLIDKQLLVDNGIGKGFCDWYNEIKYAPTIVEADKGE